MNADFNPSINITPMSAQEARECIDAIKGNLESLRLMLFELHRRRGWEALGYASFRECAVAEFGQGQAYVYRLVQAAEVEENLGQISTIVENGEIPISQLATLAKLPKEQQALGLHKAEEIAQAEGKKRNATHVAQAVKQIKQQDKKPTTVPAKEISPPPYKPGDLVRIQCQSGALPEQKTWDGCWGIVQSVGEISCVRVLVGVKEVDYMASDLDWDDNSDVQFRDTCDHLLTLWQTELEPVEENLLKFLQRRPFFTDLERQMILLMETNRSP